MEEDEGGAAPDKALILKTLLEVCHPPSGAKSTISLPFRFPFSQNLMNNAVTRPADPWVDVNEEPRELVDFLVRAGVIVEHPKDGRKVRLVHFGRRAGE